MGLITSKPDIPRQNLSEYFIVVFGERGIGKTEFALNFPGAYFLRFEDGTKTQLSYGIDLQKEARKRDVLPWEIARQAQNEFLQGNHNYKTLVWDVEDVAYDNCMDYVCEVNGYDHPSDEGYGKGWKDLNDEYQQQHRKMMSSDYGLISISHARFKEIKDIYGNKRDKLVPSVSGSVGEWLLDESDIIVFYDKDSEGNRVLRLESDKNYEAKQRLKFKESVIPAGNSGKEAFGNFKKAFDQAIEENNKRLGITKEMIEKYYNDKNKEQELFVIIEEIKQLCQEKGITLMQHKNKLEEEFGFDTMLSNDFTLDKAKKYKQIILNK